MVARHLPPGSVNLKRFNGIYCILAALDNVGVAGNVSKAISSKSSVAGTRLDRLWAIMGNFKM